jgi:copper(I)-binding protein
LIQTSEGLGIPRIDTYEEFVAVIRKVALLAVAGSLTVAGCGAGAQPQTAKPTQLTEGANFSQGGIDARDMFLLGPAPGQTLAKGSTVPVYGNLISDTDAEDALTGVSAPAFAAAGAVRNGALALPPHQLVTLGRTTTSVILSGTGSPLMGGESVKVTFTFRNARAITVSLPVVAQQGDYATYPAFTESPSATPTTSPSTSPSAGDSASPKPTGATATPVATSTAKAKKKAKKA